MVLRQLSKEQEKEEVKKLVELINYYYANIQKKNKCELSNSLTLSIF